MADALKYRFALPVYLVFEVIRYAKVQKTCLEKTGVIIAMLPIWLFVTVCWIMLWAFALALLAKLLNG
jgi:hypothetical protein